MVAPLALIGAPACAALCLATHAPADRWSDALALVPANADSVFVLPSPKQASDDLQQALERMGRAAVALGGRPIDMLRSRFGIGAGFDDRGAVVAWVVHSEQGPQFCALVPVTDAATFMQSSLTPVGQPGQPKHTGQSAAPANDPGAVGEYTLAIGGQPLFARPVGKHVLLASTQPLAAAYQPAPEFAASLAERLGQRGMAVACSGDMFVWGGERVFTAYAAQLQSTGELNATLREGFMRGAALVGQIDDALLTIDFDALGVGLRTFVRFDRDGEIAALIPASASPAAPGTLTGPPPAVLVNALPNARFYAAGGVNIRAMGGLANVRSFMASMPFGDRMPLPAWLDAVQGSVDGVQLGLYPSKLPVLAGGLVNDSAFFVQTSDPAAVKDALRAWVQSQQGERAGVRTEITWEEARTVRGETTAAGFAVKETVLNLAAAGGMQTRLAQQALIGARGLHGLATEVPGGLVVTFSQRPDVFERAVQAATAGGAATLGDQGTIKSYTPWLMLDADAVLFIGVGEMLAAAHQLASALPGDAAGMLPAIDGPVEPIAGAFRSRDGTWEAALALPSTALTIGFDAGIAAMTRGANGAAGQTPGGTAPSPAAPVAPAAREVAPTPAPSPAPAPATPAERAP